jgi:two-component sensor histidine kinase
MGEWQLLADFSFADCLLLAPVVDRSAFVILAQVRPAPAQTLHEEDMVGRIVDSRERPRVALALGEGRIVREGEPEWRDGIPIREEAIPVRTDGQVHAVIAAEQNLATARTPSQLELAYMRAAADLSQMIADGWFPFEESIEHERELSPRVGDGFMTLDVHGRVTYASPNAVSAYRRLGLTFNIIGEQLEALEADSDQIMSALADGHPVDDEAEATGAWVLRRFLPVIHEGSFRSVIVLQRDITELRARDRMLLIKDATIREVHHRVKNNLQTVASLLRLQARRSNTPETRAELEESVRRIGSIALVHETLSLDSSERVEFDRVAVRVLEMIEGSLIRPDRPVRFVLEGSAGELPSEIATPLSLILVELVQNAVEHAFPGRGGSVTVQLKRTDPGLHVVVADDGPGLPEGFSLARASSLGLQIVRTLAMELKGTLSVASEGGARFELVIPLDGGVG